MKTKFYFLIVVILIFTTGCSQKNVKIKDVENYSQNPKYYLKNYKKVNLDKKQLQKEYKERLFKPWHLEKLSISKNEANWGTVYKTKTVYSENHIKIEKQWFEKQEKNANFKNYNKVLQKAIITKNSDVRVFPTNGVIFYNPHVAGEGFPFDYNQNSRIKVNTPVLISHYSKDKAWAFIESPSVFGWVNVNNIMFVNQKQIDRFEKNDLYVIVKEGFESFDSNLAEDLKIATFFPKEKNHFLLATNAGFKKVKISAEKIQAFPLDFDETNIGLLLKEFIDEPYGWGGLNNHRDCSSFTQDFLAPFGIYVKRNSKAQTTLHEYIDLENVKDKKSYILKNGIPFLTLVYLKGHIMLYIGEQNKEPMVMHNMWGVKTWKTLFSHGRNIVGKTAITTLQPGIELYNADKTSTILKRVKGIVLLNKKLDK